MSGVLGPKQVCHVFCSHEGGVRVRPFHEPTSASHEPQSAEVDIREALWHSSRPCVVVFALPLRGSDQVPHFGPRQSLG